MVTIDKAKRVEIYRDAMNFILEQAPYAFGFAVNYIYGVQSDIAWQPRTDHRIFMDEASFAKK